MKKNSIVLAICTLLLLLMPCLSQGQKIFSDAQSAKAAFIKTDASMRKLFSNAYGYVIFPRVGKGGAVVGGAGGEGAVYERGKKIGKASMVQVNVGAQLGGQVYREVVFFENKEALDRFRDNKVEFSGQVSAVAVKSGVSANARYTEGVLVFTQEKSGLMLEASVGGQKFTYKKL
ncbi:YSC84-related protein [Chitinophagaceae bacterium MMS25-I14]